MLSAHSISKGIHFISKASVMKYLGAGAKKVVAYGVASVSGAVLAVCSCTVLPLFAGIAERVRAGGHAVFSGLLEIESESVGDALRAVGLRESGVRNRSDANGDPWSALLTTR